MKPLLLLLLLLSTSVAFAEIPDANTQGQKDATAAIQQAVDRTPPGGTLKFEPGVYRMDRMVDVTQSITIDFNGATLLLQGSFTEKGFRVGASARCESVVFRNGILLGDGTLDSNKGPVITSYSGCQINRFVIEDCQFRELTYGCDFNCAQQGWIRQAILRDCLFENIHGNDPQRGKGAAFSLNQNEVCFGKSSGNVFRNCGRHSLYCSNGGRFLSDGDAFYGNNRGGETSYPLAAISLARGSHMRVTNGYFEECRDGISLTSGDPSLTYETSAFPNASSSTTNATTSH